MLLKNVIFVIARSTSYDPVIYFCFVPMATNDVNTEFSQLNLWDEQQLEFFLFRNKHTSFNV